MVRVFLTMGIVFFPVVSVSAQPAAPVATQRALDVVPRDTFAFATINLGKLWEHPSAKPVKDFVTIAPGGNDPFARMLGISPLEIERATMFATHPQAFDEALIFVVTTRRPYTRSEIIKNLGVNWSGPVQARRSGSIVLLERGLFSAVVLADERTLYYIAGSRFRGHDDDRIFITLGKLLARSPDGPLSTALNTAPAHDVCIGVDIAQLLDTIREPAPNDLAPLLKARTALFTADIIETGLKARLVLDFPDEPTARRAVPTLEKLIDTLASEVDREARFEAGRGEAGAPFTILYRWLSWTLTTAQVKAEGSTVVATINAPVDEMITKVMARLPKSIEVSAASARVANNMKQITLAMHSYHDAMGRFPSNILGPNGRPILSWRVQILPYLEQGAMWKEVRMNEPWDSPANKALLERMPDVFAVPGRAAPRGETYFRTFVMPKGAPFQHRPMFLEGDPFGPRIAMIADGTSNTFMFVEAGESVPWTKPDDLPYDGKLPLPKLGPEENDRFWAAFCDGSVRQIRKRDNEQNIRSMITIAGGEVIFEK